MSIKKKIGIYVVTHKIFDQLNINGYKTIAVGDKLLSNQNFNTYLRDDIGDNISIKNKNYCELTAHYWIWKNSNEDIVGLCHYRRYFTRKIFSHKLNYIVSEKDISDILNNNHDIILPYRPLARRKVSDIYCDFGYERDLEILRSVISEKYPDYLKEYDDLMDRHSNYPCNMLICSKKIFDEYSEWLFDILFEVEKRVDLTNYTAQEARIFGFMSERMLEVWVLHNNLRIKHLKMISTEQKYTIKRNLIDIVSIIMNKKI